MDVCLSIRLNSQKSEHVTSVSERLASQPLIVRPPPALCLPSLPQPLTLTLGSSFPPFVHWRAMCFHERHSFPSPSPLLLLFCVPGMPSPLAFWETPVYPSFALTPSSWCTRLCPSLLAGAPLPRPRLPPWLKDELFQPAVHLCAPWV